MRRLDGQNEKERNERNKETKKERNKQTKKQTNKQTKRKKKKQTNKQRNKEKERKKERKKQTNKQRNKQTNNETNKQTKNRADVRVGKKMKKSLEVEQSKQHSSDGVVGWDQMMLWAAGSGKCSLQMEMPRMGKIKCQYAKRILDVGRNKKILRYFVTPVL